MALQDTISKLAEKYNERDVAMRELLRDTLLQLNKERDRADNLLQENILLKAGNPDLEKELEVIIAKEQQALSDLQSFRENNLPK